VVAGSVERVQDLALGHRLQRERVGNGTVAIVGLLPCE
jgi:hypothetical protein